MKLLVLLLLASGLASLVGFVWLVFQWGEPPRWPHRWAIVRAFDGNVDLSRGGNYRFDCGPADCADVIPQLPSVTRAFCGQWLRPAGACCIADFGTLYRSEVHVFHETDGTYRIALKPPYCRNPNYDPSTSRRSVWGTEFVPCFERWGLQSPPVATR